MTPDIVLREAESQHTIVGFGSARFLFPEMAHTQAVDTKTSQDVVAAHLTTTQAAFDKAGRTTLSLMSYYLPSSSALHHKNHWATNRSNLYTEQSI